MRNATLVSMVVGSSLLFAIGCKKTQDDATAKPADAGPAASASAMASAKPAVDLAAVLADTSMPLTPAMEEAILVSLADCPLKECKPYDDGIQTSCPAWGKFIPTTSRKREVVSKDAVPGYLLEQVQGNKSPAVRYQAAQMMTGTEVLANDPKAQATLVAAARKEDNPNVRAEILGALGPVHAKNDAVKTLLLENTDNAGECVRTKSMASFLRKEGANVPGTFARVEEKLASDPSLRVRRYLCSSLYGSGNERAIALFDTYLGAKDTPDEVFTGCMSGAIEAWVSAAYPDAPNAKAYEITMRVLEATPRTTERPPWVNIKDLRHAKTEFKADDHLGPAWYAKAKDFYKKDRMEKALAGIAADPKAHHLGREAAIEVLAEVGASKGTLTQLATKLAANKGDDASVKAKLDGVLARK